MSRKHIESCYLRDVLRRGTIVLKMYQTTVTTHDFFLRSSLCIGGVLGPWSRNFPASTKHLVESTWSSTNDCSHRRLIFRFTKLQFLDLTLATISTDCLTNLMGACRSLRKLSLETLPLNVTIFEWEKCFFTFTARSKTFSSRKLAANAQLDTLNLTMCTGIDLDCCVILTGQLKK